MMTEKQLRFGLIVLTLVGVVRSEMSARSQSTSAPLQFEAATIKPINTENGPRGGSCHGVDAKYPTSTPLGRCVYTHVNLAQLMLQAFPPPERLVTADNLVSGRSNGFDDVAERARIMTFEQWVSGGPNWIRTDSFDVEAKAEDPSKATRDQLREMLQSLVKERFKLAYHLEPKMISGYFIVPAKSGTKLKAVPDTPPTPEENRRLREEADKKKSAGITPFPVPQGTLTQLAIMLTLQMKVPVVTKIDIPGKWDFTALDGVDLATGAPVSTDTLGGSIFSAMQEKLGLKMEPQKIPVQIFVVDHAEKPIPN